MRSETISVHGGFGCDPATRAVARPIYQNVAYEFESADEAAAMFNLEVPRYRYSRIANPTAGMALLRQAGSLDLEVLARALEALPRWARPLFLRLAGAIETTETFKPKRRAYVEQGFDPASVSDPLFVFDGERYVPLDAGRWAAIQNGTMRF